MGKYKLTPLEELQLAKKKTREQRAIAEQRLSYQLQYLEDNWGSLLTKGLTSSVKTKFAETIDNLSHGSFSTSALPMPFKSKQKGYVNWLNLALTNLPLISKLAWRVTKPTVYAFAAKKVTGKLLGIGTRKKRKK